MKRIIFNYYHIFNCNKLRLNTQLYLFKNHPRNILQSSIRCLQCSSTKSTPKKESEEVELIYEAPQMNMVRRARLSTLMIGAMSVTAQPFLISKMFTTQGPLVYILEGGTVLLFIVPIFLHWFTRGFVYEILYDEGKSTYIAKLNNFFLRPEYVTFRIEDIQSADKTFTSFYVKGKPLILFEEAFTDIKHYLKMKGYDKPKEINLKELFEEQSRKINSQANKK